MDGVVRFAVVFNHEGQYSVWDDERPVPAGWVREGFAGPRGDCLEHIGRVWNDMTPRSLREAVAADAGR
jgi:MbtH protein